MCTLAVAEQLYDALSTWKSLRQLPVTSTSLAFFQQFDSSIAVGTYKASSREYSSLTTAIKSWADGFVAIVAEYTPSNGELSEQFSKLNGTTQVSAVDLTWSYASAITAFEARSGTTETWGAAGLTPPSVCVAIDYDTVNVTFNVNYAAAEGGQ